MRLLPLGLLSLLLVLPDLLVCGRHLVLGVAHKTPPADLRVFVASLQAHAPNAELVLWVDPSTRDWLGNRWNDPGAGGPQVHDLDEYARSAGIAEALPLVNKRYLIYRHYLASLPAVRAPSQRVWVLISDTRDVVFQLDPFHAIVKSDSLAARGMPPPLDRNPLMVAIESDTQRIGTCRYNRYMISFCYGAEELERLSHRVISCSGTTLGTLRSMSTYLDRMAAEIVDRNKQHCNDQGLHNYLLHHDLERHLTVVPRHVENSTLCTVGYVPAEQLRMDEGGRLLNAAGRVCAIVHQFDRFPVLAAHFRSLYP